MAKAVYNYLRWGSTDSAYASAESEDDESKAMRALPANWYTSPEMYELERRAIFSKKWQLVTHKVRLSKPGDFLRFHVAGFGFILCHDRHGKINGFHNVCRHRAFPVVLEERGSKSILQCKYHGWSYGLDGKLSKAPGYKDVGGTEPEFKARNGLWRIHTHIDHNGFIWINLDGKTTPEVAWEDDFAGIDTREIYQNFNFDDYEFDHEWQMDGTYNWKILADNYNECYHCATTHPDIPALADLTAYSVSTKKGQIIHNVGTTEEQKKAGLIVAATYYFPNVSTNVS